MSTIPARPRDTTAEAEAQQVALLRAATASRRLAVAFGLSATIIGAARRALARLDPAASKRDLALRFVALHYGRDLAGEVAAALERRERDTASRS